MFSDVLDRGNARRLLRPGGQGTAYEVGVFGRSLGLPMRPSRGPEVDAVELRHVIL